MSGKQGGLGRLFDIAVSHAPVDLSAAAVTGKRVHLKNYVGATFVLFKGAGTAGDDPAVTFQQHTVASSGTPASLVAVTRYYLKDATTLAGTEQWAKLSMAAGATITDPGGAGTSAEHQQILVAEFNADQLDDGYEWISANVADVGTNAQLGAGLWILHGLQVSRSPELLAQPNA